MSLLIVGAIALDKIETPFAKIDQTLGGAASYSSLAASYFVKKPRLISIIGKDFPVEYKKIFSSHKIDTRGLIIEKDLKTFSWSGKYYNDMNICKTLNIQLNALKAFEPVVPDSYLNSEYLLLGSLSPIIQSDIILNFKKRPKLIIMDTQNYWINNMVEDLIETISKVDVLSINDEEARNLAKEFSLLKAAKKIMKMGPKFLIINKGKHGTLLFQGKKIFYAPSLPLEEIFDPTGNGDAFSGGFSGYLSKTGNISFDNMKRAIIFGSALASFCAEKFGTEKLQNLTQKQISRRVQEYVDLVQFDYTIE